MDTRPPEPPPRGPGLLTVLAYILGGFVLLVVAGVGLVIASCGL